MEIESQSGCWLWTGPRGSRGNSAGYGVLREGRRFLYAHRIALENKLGRPIGKGKQALHRCDNRRCVNPDHLYEGTARENMADRSARGDGWKSGPLGLDSSRLVREYEGLPFSGMRKARGAVRDLGKAFGCTVQTIYYHVSKAHGRIT